MNERAVIWRKVPDLPGYFASSEGSIKGPSNRVLSLKKCKSGYMYFGVSDGKGGSKNKSVARSVCSAFNGLSPVGFDADHINRIRDDNRPDNLRWVSRSENLKNRRCALGEDHHNSKATESMVRQIRDASHYRGFDRDFGKRVGISRETIRDIRLGKLWRHIQ